MCNNDAFKKNNRVLVKYSSEFYCIGAFLGRFFCHVLYHLRAIIPSGIIAISDVMILIEDMGNQIPDKSWMLYLEIFNKQNIPAEFNLIRSFHNDGKFDAIFNGINWYQFKQVSPAVGHRIRQIIMNSQKRVISYILEDRNTKQIQRFDLSVNRVSSIYS